MRIGIGSSAFFSLFDYEEGFKKAKYYGWDCLDFQCFNREENAIYSLPEDEFIAILKSMKKCAIDNGVELYQSHAPWWPICTEDKIPFYEKAIRGNSILGIPYMVVHPVTNFCVEDDSAETMQAVYSYNLRYFRKLLPCAKEYGVTLCIENLPVLCLGLTTVTQIKQLVEELDDPHIKACLDTGHVHVCGDNMEDAIMQLGDKLKVVHVHDNDGLLGDEHLPAYLGSINWDSFYHGLKQVHFNGVMSFELVVPFNIPMPLLDEFHLFIARLARYMSNQVEA